MATENDEPLFEPRNLDKTVIAIPLLEYFEKEKKDLESGKLEAPENFPVIIDLNLDYKDGLEIAKEEVVGAIREMTSSSRNQGINDEKNKFSKQYIFAELKGNVIRKLVKWDEGGMIYQIWPDFEIKSLINKSVSTIKADAAQTSFAAYGDGIVWAVLDSGIDEHVHFDHHNNLDLENPLKHKDFTGLELVKNSVKTGDDEIHALKDRFGHGTHVAGIIAGGIPKGGDGIKTYIRKRDEKGETSYKAKTLESISGVAPRCKLVSYKVLDDNGNGLVSNLIVAIEHILEINGYGRRLLIHGVNLSVGYNFDPEWFACGQSPLCVEVDRLVRSGVVVVVAAGNTGYGYKQSQSRGVVSAGMDLTINDPGNAELAITVGATHKDMPHIYGVSYFSSKGPTGDGRAKPDLVAPGEKIISCAAGEQRKEMMNKIREDCDYLEESGTSMAAPHVSGAIASFLSIRREFIGRPDKVKEIFLSTATNLNRERYFQGHGLVDLMRAIQSV